MSAPCDPDLHSGFAPATDIKEDHGKFQNIFLESILLILYQDNKLNTNSKITFAKYN